MSDADVYRIEELPADELDGASGAKRKFQFEFIGIVIDKIEVGNSVGLTADEIQKLSSGAESFLAGFLKSTSVVGRPTRYCLIADQLVTKFSEQADEDFAIMQEELHNIKTFVKKQGGEVLDQPNDILGFTEDIDRRLPKLEEVI